MSYTHVVNGDVAAGLLRQALGEAQHATTITVMRDDLAVGPIRALDDTTTVRAAFWHRVLMNPMREVAHGLDDELATLRQLGHADHEVVVWHGQSAGDQLALRRLAYHLRNSPQRLNEVNLSPGELPRGAEQPGGVTAVGHYPVETLAGRLKSVAPISILRIGRLALEWQELKQSSSDIRRWHDNTFESGSFAELDTLILERAPLTRQPAHALLGTVMRLSRGFCATDVLILWRFRELIRAGRLEASSVDLRKDGWIRLAGGG